ncbi:hypothetical protein KIL84_007392 [Mauremys mutica]|uniref:Uncharacterized protein n=1 Tax=Mauremys mutica TaxID=74926 RepID=A0A9D3WXB2_9SAUR|nr:hypothetical protein KIL84_007392 [Mauremys mutica]
MVPDVLVSWRDTQLETLNSIDISESEKEEVAKRASSKRVTISGIVGPTEECGSSKRGLAVASRSSIIKETKRDPSVQSEKQQRKDHLKVKKSKSTERKKSRENVAEYKTENNLQASELVIKLDEDNSKEDGIFASSKQHFIAKSIQLAIVPLPCKHQGLRK